MIAASRGFPVLVGLLLGTVLVWLALSNLHERGPSLTDSPDPAAAAPVPEEPELAVRRPIAGASSDADDSRIRLRGRVVDAYGETVRGALVGDADSPRPSITDADGRFELSTAGARPEIVLLVVAAGHPPLTVERAIGRSLGPQDLGDLQLLRGGRVHGQVTDAAGAPLSGATVTPQLLASGWWSSAFDLGELLEPAVTDAAGRYAFEQFVPGSYRLGAAAPGRQRGQSGPITVPDGAEVPVAPIALATGHCLDLLVRDPDGRPVAGAGVRLREVAGQTRFEATGETDLDGRSTIDALPPGPLRLVVTRIGFLTCERAEVLPTGDLPLVVTLERGLGIAGTVLDALTGDPVERFAASIRRIGPLQPTSNGTIEQQLARELDSLRASAAAAGDPAIRRGQLDLADQLAARIEELRRRALSQPVVVPAEVGPLMARPGGRFSFDGLEEGAYSIGIASPDHRFATIDAALRRGVQATDLRVELVTGHAVSGVVVSRHDGRPVGGAEIGLVRILDAPAADRPPSAYSWAFARRAPPGVTLMSTRTAADGSFALGQAAPGLAFLSVRHPSFADRDTDEFAVRDGVPRLRIELGRRAVLSGRVVAARPGRELDCEVLVVGGHGTLRTSRVRADGTYRFADLQPGGYVVRAFPSEAREYVRRLLGAIFAPEARAIAPESIPACDLTLAEGESRVFDLAVDLPPAGVVQGTVSINGRAGSGRVMLRPVPGAAPGSGGLPLRAELDGRGGFELRDVPAGRYALLVYGATRQELHEEALTIAPEAVEFVQIDIASGAVRGRIAALDPTPAEALRGYVWVLPGATEVPEDLYEYRRAHRTHRVQVRAGRFEDSALTPGPATIVVDVRDHARVTTAAIIPAGDTIDLELTLGGRTR
jgi:protocatechuate 3,4-dioxygenase beta subunit